LRLALLLLPLVFACFALSPTALAVSPPPDGGYPGGNTAEGTDALFSNTLGRGNTANGYEALFSNTTGGNNTAIGPAALYNNNGDNNTAIGDEALNHNNADNNTATGRQALFSNTTGSANTATGVEALWENTEGHDNTATGNYALFHSTGVGNTANGVYALFSNTGSFNIALGYLAGQNLTTGDYNIDIGNQGGVGEANTIRIGDQNQTNTYIAGISGVTVSGAPVVVASDGHLGTGPAVTGFVTGAILQMTQGQPAPAGFTKIGTTKMEYKDLTGHKGNLTLDLYQKN